jgi:lipopolysaccharide transport system permease protein
LNTPGDDDIELSLDESSLVNSKQQRQPAPGGVPRLMTLPGRSQTVVIEPAAQFVPLRLSSVWSYRELLYFLVWRDIKVRYKHTVLGAFWAIGQPVLTMVVFTLFLGKLANVPSDGAPYALFAFCGLLPWQFFASALTHAGNSVVNNQALITKVYFPRLVIPLAATLSGLVDFAISFLVLIVLLLVHGYTPTLGVLYVPLFVVLAFLAALGAGLWLSALQVLYRDIRHVIPFLVQFWMFATPIAYPASLVPDEYRTLYFINPMVGVVEGFRWAFLGTGQPPGAMTLVSSIVVVVVLIGGAFYFRRMERVFADLV